MFVMYLMWQHKYDHCVTFVSVEKVLQRGEKIDVLVGKTEELDHSVS